MRKRIILLLCMLLVLGGCGKEASDNTGVYYQKISEKEVSAKYNSMALYMCSLLYYNGRMYISTFRYQAAEKEDLDCTILGDEIGSVFRNHYQYWSTDEDKLSESTGEEKIYRINGYDEDFRIAVYYEAYYEMMLPPATTYNLIVFERLNDITLYSGNELFEDRLHLSEAAAVKSDTKEMEVDAEIKEFLNAMNEGIFLDPQDEEYLSLNSLQGYPLSFYDSMGFATDIMVYEEGYVSMEQRAGKAFVLKMDAHECENILEKMYFGE